MADVTPPNPGAASERDRPARRGPALALPTRHAVLALLALGLVPFLVLQLHHGRRPLGDQGGFLHRQAGEDSWAPIALALDHLERHGPDGLYAETYFHSSAQFVYSPLSLVLFRRGSIPGVLDWHDKASMNRFSWWIVVLMAAATALVMLRVGGPAPGATAQGRTLERAIRIALAFGATFLFFPAIHSWTVGNLQSWLNLACVLAILFWVYRLPFAAGFLLGLASVVKPQNSLFLIWGLWRREKGFVLGMLAAVVPLGVISLTQFGWPVHAEYLSLIRHLSGRGEAYFASQCMNGLLNRMFFIGNNLTWDGSHASIPYNPYVHLATTLSSLALLVPSLWWRPHAASRWWRPQAAPARDPLDFCTAMLTFTLAAPIVFNHHYGFMVPIFWLVLTRIVASNSPGRGWRLALLGLAFVGCAQEIWPMRILAATPFNFLQSYLYFGALIVLGLMYGLRAEAARSSGTERQERHVRHGAGAPSGALTT